jgi:hypothetical protein
MPLDIGPGTHVNQYLQCFGKKKSLACDVWHLSTWYFRNLKIAQKHRCCSLSLQWTIFSAILVPATCYRLRKVIRKLAVFCSSFQCCFQCCSSSIVLHQSCAKNRSANHHFVISTYNKIKKTSAWSSTDMVFLVVMRFCTVARLIDFCSSEEVDFIVYSSRQL